MPHPNYYKVVFSKYAEGLLGLLSQLPFESFEETEAGEMICYIKEEDFGETAQAEATRFADLFDTQMTLEVVPPQNWNAVWESNFEPVEVDDFCRIRADFHPSVSGFTYELLINPKMAFGTGHHETTHMMIQMMRSLEFSNRVVLDYGCGTGVLAILANLMGSKEVHAVDIEVPSYESTIENSELNGAINVEAYLGDLYTVPKKQYDIVLANINRNVLLASCNDLYAMVNKNSIVMLSGILTQDYEKVLETYEGAGFMHQRTLDRGYWKCILLKR